jgi:MYXO-CTERM domain-containing protein
MHTDGLERPDDTLHSVRPAAALLLAALAGLTLARRRLGRR